MFRARIAEFDELRALPEFGEWQLRHAVDAGFPPDEMDYDAVLLAAIDERGALTTVLLETETGEVVGYCVVIHSPDLLRAGQHYAQSVALFLAPEQRGRVLTAVKAFVDAVASYSRERGAKRIAWGAPAGSALSAILDRVLGGGVKAETYYMQEVG